MTEQNRKWSESPIHDQAKQAGLDNAGEAQALPSSSGSEYHIESVEDFLKVPEDRIADCLEEFADFIEVSRSMLMFAKNMAEVLGVEDSSQIGAYTWIDDGKKEKSIRLVPSIGRGNADE